MIVFPNAKINLGLNITEKRQDGYHNILSCFYPVGWSDILEIIPAASFSFQSTGIDIPGDPETNLVVKAFRLLKKDFNLPEVAIHLHKVIPIGAGLGGGSSDCAFAFKALNDLFELKMSSEKMQQYAQTLGSDCPFFIENKPLFVSGTGNQFQATNLSLKGKYIILVYPELHISTKEAYAGITPKPLTDDPFVLLEGPVNQWKGKLSNDFEISLFPNYPFLEALKQKFYDQGALYASMTGSGSTVFGIFENKTTLNFPSQYTVWEGFLE
ncbi:4-(cytidine 5'-diphospho)-2-C-methyl-D-erythritol kinase [Flexithrix dorotheae]|uniref:4-(cytidine 5'-diphospho)-2-C-methyl-D-erythritol kinase n=1 Tax=Flexithrix dorotheae TaxID=70993 RepID=UPI00037CFD66|nr:4-(cytidine 5'-diphospho)-2-C-methyl-D-erythritol kinase [Flexithrix dorotheae]